VTHLPRAVFAFPTYNAEAYVADTLKSLLEQDFGDFAVFALDDCSTDRTVEIVQTFAGDPRLSVEKNDRRLGMINNWNRAWMRARDLYGDFEYFAWASDNDLRDSTWLRIMVEALDKNPDAAMAYSRLGVLDEQKRNFVALPKWQFESRGISDPSERFRTLIKSFAPIGAMMYGLHRRPILEQIGGIPKVIVSDHLFLARVALHGQFIQEQDSRWYRGDRRTGGTRKGQRSALFSVRPPLLTYAPIWVQHSHWLFSTLVFRRRGRPDISRMRAIRLTLAYITTQWSRVLRASRFQFSRSRARKRRVWGGGPRVSLRPAIGLELSRRLRVADRDGKYSPEIQTELALISRRLRMSRSGPEA
jgi:Glycosyl transferase family 2